MQFIGSEFSSMFACVFSDLRRAGSSPGKTEAEQAAGGPPKSCPDVKLERTEGSAAEKAPLCPGSLETVKNELREEASGHSSVSDLESDSDSPSEVNDLNVFFLTSCV